MRKIKIMMIAAMATSCLAAPAFAASDGWTGPYIGIHTGYTDLKSNSAVTLGGAWSSESSSLQNDVASNWSNSQSFGDMNYGAQIGYNYETNGVVLGIEADISMLNGSDTDSRGPIAATATPSLTYTYGNHVDPKHMFSLRGRLGVPMGDTLLYVHGGWAWTRAQVGAEILSNGGYSKEGIVTDTFDGYIVGAGIEHKFTPNISARVEYSYTDQGHTNYATAYRPGSTFTSPVYSETVTQDMRMHIARVGLNFHL